eukprot:7385523-Prymnesium_polylepis.2
MHSRAGVGVIGIQHRAEAFGLAKELPDSPVALKGRHWHAHILIGIVDYAYSLLTLLTGAVAQPHFVGCNLT